ncbi:nucleoside triphosphate pyrophosphatase [Brevibacterium salitolerans]|uniref:Maf family protein n=1 Tax=Brevibacterium salitolerans TaxID=1403566 RepID=UPI0031DC9045
MTASPVPTAPRLLLASASPSRRRILRSAGIDPLVHASAVDEDALEAAHPGASVRELVGILAEAKARAVADALTATHPAPLLPELADRGDGQAPRSLVLVACDSVLELDGEAVGKPHTADRTRALWARMAGTSPVLWSAHWAGLLTRETADAPWHLADHRASSAATTVHLASPTHAELEAYIATEEPFEVAGALTIDGLGGAFVTGIEGDHHNVIGLSLPLLRRMLMEMGLRWTDLWTSGTAAAAMTGAATPEAGGTARP